MAKNKPEETHLVDIMLHIMGNCQALTIKDSWFEAEGVVSKIKFKDYDQVYELSIKPINPDQEVKTSNP